MKLRTDSMYTLEGPTTMAQGSGMKLGRRTPQGGQLAHALGGLPRPDSHRRSRANAGGPAGARPGLQVKLKHPGQASRHVPIGGTLARPSRGASWHTLCPGWGGQQAHAPHHHRGAPCRGPGRYTVGPPPPAGGLPCAARPHGGRPRAYPRQEPTLQSGARVSARGVVVVGSRWQ